MRYVEEDEMSDKVKISVEQGQRLFQMSISAKLPEKIGDKTYDLVERHEAAEGFRELYRELKSRSPVFLKDRKSLQFGPAEAWEEVPNGAVITDQNLKVEVKFNEDCKMGVFYMLVMCLHPASGQYASPREQEEVLWPLAQKLKITNMVKKEIGVFNARKRRLELDGPSDKQEAPPAEERQEEEVPVEA